MPPAESVCDPNVRPAEPAGSVDMVRLTSIIGAVACFVAVPFDVVLLGPWIGLLAGLTGVAFLGILWRLRRGDHRAASRWLVSTCVVGVGFSHLAFGGLSGWSFTMLTILPMLAILVDRGSRALGLQVGVAVFAVIVVSYLVPDLWMSGPPSETVVRHVRVVFAVLSIGAAGIVATFAVRRLETAMGAALETEREARAATERKTSFLANISHELRTPMNAILGYSELVLEDDEVSHGARTDIGRIRQAGTELLGLIDEVLRVARIDADGGAIRETFQISELVHRWVASSDGTLVAEDGEVVPGAVQIDPVLLDRMVRSLVEGYRAETTPHGSSNATIEISTRLVDEGVVVRLRPTCALDPDRPIPLVWLLAQRSARSAGVRLRMGAQGRVELVMPSRSQSAAELRLGGTEDPVAALRVRLATRVVWLSLGVLGVVAPISIVMHGEGASAVPLVVGWGAMLLAILVLFRTAHHRLARVATAVGQLMALTVVQSLYGGSGDVGMVYFPAVTVLGTFILGPRGGFVLTGLAVGCALTMGVADEFHLLPSTVPDPRLVVAFVTAAATGLSAAEVVMLATPLEALVRSAREAALRASEADRATNQFLDAVSVELRTPLSAILGYAELVVEDHESAPELQADVGRIVDSGRHLLGLVDDLLDMSAIAGDQMELDVETVDLAALLISVLLVVRPLVQRRGNTVSLTVEPEVRGLRADPQRLRQILLNLLSNAAKFTENGTISVRASVGRGDSIAIAVEDTGIGIDDADQRKLFQPFRQVHRGNPGQYGGTGLGLAISRRLARKMGGDIQVRSALGAGSVFVLSLPSHADEFVRRAG